MGKPKIAFLAHRIPYPPDKGDKIRSYHTILSLRSFAKVTVACIVDDAEDLRHIEPLSEFCDELIAVPLHPWRARVRSLFALPTGRPLSLAYYTSRGLRRRLAELGEFDSVLAFSSTMAPYAHLVRARRRVLDLCDLDSEKWAQYSRRRRGPIAWIQGIEAHRLGDYEAEVAAQFDASLLISQDEAGALRRRAPSADVRVVPNGIDLDVLDPAEVDAEAEPHTAVFCGAMDYFSNEDAVVHYCREIMPRIRREIPDARFRIVGSKPTARVRELGRIDGVTVTGRVVDVRPEIMRGSVSVAPLRLGRGVPNKILEALALELPVVTTPNGAAGLELDRFPGADVASSVEEFAAAVVRRFREADDGRVRRFPEHRPALRELYRWSRHRDMLRAALLGDDA